VSCVQFLWSKFFIFVSFTLILPCACDFLLLGQRIFIRLVLAGLEFSLAGSQPACVFSLCRSLVPRQEPLGAGRRARLGLKSVHIAARFFLPACDSVQIERNQRAWLRFYRRNFSSPTVFSACSSSASAQALIFSATGQSGVVLSAAPGLSFVLEILCSDSSPRAPSPSFGFCRLGIISSLTQFARFDFGRWTFPPWSHRLISVADPR
jgi:hypothetical protein